jgi:carboxypeptidase family protein
MYRFSRALVLSIFAVLGCCAATPSAQTGHAGIRGAIADSSGGALPGVTVVAASPEGQVLATAVSDGAGAYEISGLPAGELRLTFQLDGFATAAESIAVEPGTVSTVQKRLELAPVTETVVVVGEASVLSPGRSSLPPPLPEIVPVPTHDRESVCGPAKAGAISESFGTIRSGRFEAKRDLYTKEDELIIDGGTLDGLEAGQNLVVRRYFRTTDAAGGAIKGEHTAGLLQIAVADDHVSTAVVVYACDELRKGDFLAPFKPEPARSPDPAGIPAFDDAARILFADAGQMLGAPRRLMVIDRGSDQGIHVGQRVTLFRRRRHDAAKPSIVGDAVVVAIRSDSATIRVVGASDVISSGDWAAPQRQSRVATAVQD